MNKIEDTEQTRGTQRKLVYYQIPEMSFKAPKRYICVCVREFVYVYQCLCSSFGLSK